LAQRPRLPIAVVSEVRRRRGYTGPLVSIHRRERTLSVEFRRKILGQGGADAYTPTSFTLTADIATVFLGLSIVGYATTDAKRIGDVCPVAP
jgi:hypothetical protein